MAFDIARVHSSQRNGATGAFLLWLSKVSIEKLLKFRFAMQKWLFFLHVVLIARFMNDRKYLCIC